MRFWEIFRNFYSKILSKSTIELKYNFLGTTFTVSSLIWLTKFVILLQLILLFFISDHLPHLYSFSRYIWFIIYSILTFSPPFLHFVLLQHLHYTFSVHLTSLFSSFSVSPSDDFLLFIFILLAFSQFGLSSCSMWSIVCYVAPDTFLLPYYFIFSNVFTKPCFRISSDLNQISFHRDFLHLPATFKHLLDVPRLLVPFDWSVLTFHFAWSIVYFSS